MRWTRFIHHGQTTLGCVDGDETLVHTGDLFAHPRCIDGLGTLRNVYG